MELATQEKIIERELAYNVGTESKLSPGERERLDAAVKIIDKGMDTFLTVGAALLGIKEGKLYRETHPTFEAFCKAKWSMSRPRAYQLIASVKVVNTLSHGMSTTVDKPTSERQVRVLAALPTEQQSEAWTEAVATAPKGKVTAAHVQSVVDRFKQPDRSWVKNEYDRKYVITAIEEKVSTAISILEVIRDEGTPAEKLKYGIKIIKWCARNLTGFDAALKAVRAIR